MCWSIDPLAEKFAGHNGYEYCFNNPVRFIDPTGLESVPSKDLKGKWHKFNTKVDDVSLKEVTVVGHKNPSNGVKVNGNNNSEAKIAANYIGDQRRYSLSNIPGTIDCSRFTRDVAFEAGYKLPRQAFDQANWFRKNGFFSTSLDDIEEGDHIFWERAKNAYHTEIILDTSNPNSIKVIHSQTFNHQPGSIRVQTLMKNGQIKGFHQPFVGVGKRNQ